MLLSVGPLDRVHKKACMFCWTIYLIYFAHVTIIDNFLSYLILSYSARCENLHEEHRILYHQGAWTLSMISYRSMKMTSNYATSCLEVRNKQKVNKPIFKGFPHKNMCKYQHFNHIVFSCSACLQKKYAIIVRYAVYKAWSLHKGQLTLHDAIVSHHQNGRIVTFKPWSCTMPLFPITKMVELLLLSNGHVCNIMCIKAIFGFDRPKSFSDGHIYRCVSLIYNTYAIFSCHYIPLIVFQLQLQGNQSQEALQRALEHIHRYC